MSIVSARHGRALLRGGIALAAAVSTLAVLPTTAAAVATPSAIVDDAGCRANTLPANDDQSTGDVALPSTFTIGGQQVPSVRISNNGYFHTSSFNSYFGPFIADLDTRYTPTPMTYGETTFAGRQALCANWLAIGIFGRYADSPTNDIQALLVDRSDVNPGDFDAVFNYGRVDGDSSYGSGARLGFFAQGLTYAHPGSDVPGAFLDSNAATGLVHHSRGSDVLGRYVFKFRQGALVSGTEPDTTISSGPGERTADADVALTYTSTATDEGHQRFECRLTPAGGTPAAFGTCDDEGTSYDDVAEGTYTFEVRAVDSYGNTDETPASQTFTVDTTGPDTALDAVPAALGNDRTPTFDWSSEADDLASFECTLDRTQGGEPSPWYPCDAEDDGTLTDLADGQWTFRVRGVDDLGNADATPASYDFVVDTEATGVTITSAPRAVGNDSTPTFTYAAAPDTDVDRFECVVVPDGAQSADLTACDTAGFTSESLADGHYRFGVRVVDHAENPGDPALYDFTVDTVAPDTTVTPAQAATVTGRSVAFGFAADETGSTFECRLVHAGQDPSWQACSDGSASFGGLTNGTYAFEARATDAAGNTDATPATGSVTVSLDKPTITASLSSAHPVSAFGWYRSAVTITYTCDARLSTLVGACPAPRLVPRAQRGRTFRASVATVDGDTASVSTTLHIDKGMPKAEILGFSGRRTYSSVPRDIRCKASDPRSGLADCTLDVTRVTRAGQRFVVVRATATDKAGNVRVVTRKAPLDAA